MSAVTEWNPLDDIQMTAPVRIALPVQSFNCEPDDHPFIRRNAALTYLGINLSQARQALQCFYLQPLAAPMGGIVHETLAALGKALGTPVLHTLLEGYRGQMNIKPTR